MSEGERGGQLLTSFYSPLRFLIDDSGMRLGRVEGYVEPHN